MDLDPERRFSRHSIRPRSPVSVRWSCRRNCSLSPRVGRRFGVSLRWPGSFWMQSTSHARARRSTSASMSRTISGVRKLMPARSPRSSTMSFSTRSRRWQTAERWRSSPRTCPAHGEKTLTPGAHVRISIRDYGSGISADILPLIFDPYFITKGSGSGLGLTTAYAIVSKHGGRLSVESKSGEGTVFRIDLPASQSAAAPEEPMGALPPSGTGRVLVMDDEENIRTLLTHVLSRLGYDVSSARDGAEAVDLYKAARESGRGFDVVLLDLTVHCGMGGVETAARLKSVDPSVSSSRPAATPTRPSCLAAANTVSTTCCRSRGRCHRSANCSGGSWPLIPNHNPSSAGSSDPALLDPALRCARSLRVAVPEPLQRFRQRL